MNSSTLSETLFEEYCLSRRYVAERIPPKPEEKTPDYLLRTASCQIICEVKQLEPNVEDLARLAELKSSGTAEGSHYLGKRVRAAIRSAKEQLKKAESASMPSMLVIYDTTPFGYLYKHDVESAMFGCPRFGFSKANPETRIVRTEGREFSEEQKRYISAVAVLKGPSGALALTVYRNPYAGNPIPPDSFVDVRDQNIQLNGWR